MDPEKNTTSTVRLTETSDISSEGNFPQGCSFSPDGLCVLTSTAADNQLRLYNTVWDEDRPNWKMSLSARGGDTVRSYAWFPAMNSSDPGTCCFLGASRDQPVHLYDAYTARIRATYRPFNALDELESPSIVAFSPDGQSMYTSGFKSDRMIHVFDTNIPGRDSTVLRLGKTRRSTDGQKGLVSSLAFSGMSHTNRIFCVGTYAPGSIYVYDDRMPGQASTVLNGVCVVGHGRSHSRKRRRFVVSNEDDAGDTDIQSLFTSAKVKWFQSRARGGVTQLQFSPSDDFKLYSASRQSDAVLAWDLRMLSGNSDHAPVPIHGIASFATESDTNQRLEFDLDNEGKRLFIGGRDKCVRVYDTVTGKLLDSIDGFADVANGVSYFSHQESDTELLAIAIGARRFPEEHSDSEGEPETPTEVSSVPGALALYKLQSS